MMNAQQLVSEVSAIIKDSSFSDTDILSRLNNAQVAVASQILLPELSDGEDSLNTVAGENRVQVPADYHRHLYYAIDVENDKPLTVSRNIRDFEDDYGPISTDSGDLSAVCVSGSRDAPNSQRQFLYYQAVPEEPKAIKIRYYRLPRDLTDNLNSYPDGSFRTEYEQALIFHACAYMWLHIEEGVEGKFSNHTKYMELFNNAVLRLDRLEERNRPRKKIPVCQSRF